MKFTTEIDIPMHNLELFHSEQAMLAYIRRESIYKLADTIIDHVEYREEDTMRHSKRHSFVIHCIGTGQFDAIVNALKVLDLNATESQKQIINDIYNNLS